jgi:hypothetical protein
MEKGMGTLSDAVPKGWAFTQNFHILKILEISDFVSTNFSSQICRMNGILCRE